MADSARIEAMQEETHPVRQTKKSRNYSTNQYWQDDSKAKERLVMKNKKEEDQTCSALEAVRYFVAHAASQVFSNLSDGSEMAFLMVPLKRSKLQEPGIDEISNFLIPNALLNAKYALEILKKHNMDNCHSIGTPLATKPKLDVDLSGEPVDQSDYRSKIGSLMYLTSSRPDLVQQYAIGAVNKARQLKLPQVEVKES
ncbi:retrovirus-related pol polyprotein from transposon TNT 1-94 [Tanacetum coccineum]|uniref:Retrovirus-related pol polyprotein from transposon TNT 1-94 n=1 Tax=Tanacetum coccineum TaxID=301880 RepID=A0ABQ4ZWA4_9ASTR